MNNRSSCCRGRARRVLNMIQLRGHFRRHVRIYGLVLICALAAASRAYAGDAPGWMHAVANAELPAHDEKTDAVLLYSEQNVTVLSADKIRTQVRVVYKILRPGAATLDACAFLSAPRSRSTA